MFGPAVANLAQRIVAHAADAVSMPSMVSTVAGMRIPERLVLEYACGRVSMSNL